MYSWIILTSALLVALALILLITLFAWRRGGFRELLRYARSASLYRGKRGEQVLMEDVLKGLYNRSGYGDALAINSLSYDLAISNHRLIRCLFGLEHLGLVQLAPLQLTEEGRQEALLIIRTHRLYEKFLSETSGLSPAEWHAAAEKFEHSQDAESTQQLARRLGFPKVDPHGDPIPDASGHYNETPGFNLNELKEFPATVELLRIGDHNVPLYKSIISKGIYVGLIMQVLNRNDKSYQVFFEGLHVSLSIVEASALRVTPYDGAPLPKDLKRLSQLKLNEEAEVYGLSGACHGPNRRRLLDLGFVRGSKIRIDLESPMRNPTAYLVRGTAIALRKDQSDYILVINQKKIGKKQEVEHEQ